MLDYSSDASDVSSRSEAEKRSINTRVLANDGYDHGSITPTVAEVVKETILPHLKSGTFPLLSDRNQRRNDNITHLYEVGVSRPGPESVNTIPSTYNPGSTGSAAAATAANSERTIWSVSRLQGWHEELAC